jgi:hypothetical protein
MEHNFYVPALLQIVAWQYIRDIITIFFTALAVGISLFAFRISRQDKNESDLSKYAKDQDLKELKQDLCERLAKFHDDNLKSHAEMKTETTMVEHRFEKRADEVKSDFLREVENMNSKIDIILKRLLKGNGD